MKHVLFYGLVLLIAVSCVHRAPETTLELSPIPVSNTQCPANHPHMLWRVQNDSHTVWILGSIHMADSNLYPLAPAIQAAFDQSPALAVEINVTEDSLASEVNNQIVSHGVLPSGQTLKQKVGSRLWNRLDSALTAMGESSHSFQSLQPWLAALQISNLAIMNTGIDPQLGIDVVLIAAAHETQKQVISLETPSQQIGVFAEMPDSTQILYLERTLDEAMETPALMDSLFYYWRCGDAQGLEHLLLDTELNQPEFSDLKNDLYTQRNHHMAQAVEGFLKTGPTIFMVVGTAHLLGEDSVIEILKNHGLSVERF